MAILYDHLQKTGGTAFASFIRTHSPQLSASPLILHERVPFLSFLTNQFDFVVGHTDLTLDYSWPSNIIHVTLLRDPVERFLSHYSYVRSLVEADDPFGRLTKTHTLDELIRRDIPICTQYIQHFYAGHFLAGMYSPNVVAKMLKNDSIDVQEVHDFIADHYAFVGLAEHMDLSARLFCVRFLQPTTDSVPLVRASEKRLQVTDLQPETLARILQLSAVDRALYRLVADEFYAMLDADLAPAPRSNPKRRRKATHSLTTSEDVQNCILQAVELTCNATGTTSNGMRGRWCTLSLVVVPLIDADEAEIQLAIFNSLKQVAYRESFCFDMSKASVGQPFECRWRFLCTLGDGLYDCDFLFRMVDLSNGSVQQHCFTSAYQFQVFPPPQASSAGACHLDTVFETVVRDNPFALEGTITFVDMEITAEAGSLALISLVLANTGLQIWPSASVNRANLAYWLQGPGQNGSRETAERQPIMPDVSPGEQVEVDLVVQAPDLPGCYQIHVALVQERIAWFCVPSQTMRLIVQPSVTAAQVVFRNVVLAS